jgi:serine protease Do
MSATRRYLALSAVPAAALIGGIAGGTLVLGGMRNAVAQDPVSLTAGEKATAASLESAFMRVADTAGPATVSIEVKVTIPASRGRSFFGEEVEMPERQSSGSGSGLIVRSDGWILTNDHVVENATGGKVSVKLADGQIFEGTVRRDQQSDLALIKIDTSKPLPTMTFADSDRLHVGQWAIAIGSPFGQQNSMTTGIVSALHRKSAIGRFQMRRTYPSLIQTDAAINQGNSGGPLLNINGELIGVNVALFSPSGTSAGIGFAIPSNTAKYVVEQLINKGKVTRGFLGIVPADLTEADRKTLGANVRGVRVQELGDERDTPVVPARQAGIEVDDVITEFDGKPVTDEISFRDAIGTTPPGKSVPVKLLRDDKPLTLSVTLSEAPEKRELPRPRLQVPPGATVLQRLGLELRPLKPEESKSLALLDGAGVWITKVEPDSPASAAKLPEGAALMSIGGTKIATPAAAEAALSRVKSGDPVPLRIVQKSQKSITSSIRVLTMP